MPVAQRHPGGLSSQAGMMLLASMALVIGMIAAVLPVLLVVSVLLIPAVAMLMVIRPEYGLTALIALACSLIHPDFVPRIPIMGGSVAAADAVLIMLGIQSIWVLATRPREAKAPSVGGARFLAVVLSLFALCFVVDVVLSLWVKGVNPTWVLGEARRLIYLLALPIAVVLLQRPDQQRRFVIGLVVLGCLFSVGQIFQGVFHIPVFGEKGRLVVLETMGRQDAGTTRSLTLGIQVIVFAILLTVGGYVMGAVRKPLFFAVMGLLLTGIFLSFGRTTFGVVAVCTVILVAWLNLKKLGQLAGLFFLLVAVASVLAISLKPDYFDAVLYRITSIDTEIASGDSAQWRFWEVEEMLPHIEQYPITGLGLGADYKAAHRAPDEDLNRYMHNAYFYMAGKMGLPALAFFLLAMFAVLKMGRRTAKSGSPRWIRIVSAACAAMMINFLLASITEPHFMEDYSLILIGVAGALAFLTARDATRSGTLGTTNSESVGARARARARRRAGAV